PAAANALSVAAGREVPRARGAARLLEEEAVRADRLVVVVLDHRRPAAQERERERSQRGAGEVDDVRGAEEAPQRRGPGLAHDPVGERGVVEPACGRAGRDGDLDARLARQALAEELEVRLHAADRGREAGGDDEDLHAASATIRT